MPEDSDKGAIIVAFSVPGGWKVVRMPPGALIGDISNQNIPGYGVSHPA